MYMQCNTGATHTNSCTHIPICRLLCQSRARAAGNSSAHHTRNTLTRAHTYTNLQIPVSVARVVAALFQSLLGGLGGGGGGGGRARPAPPPAPPGGGGGGRSRRSRRCGCCYIV